MRKASLKMVTDLGEQLACVACVIEGSGFRAATVRSVLAGMALLLGNNKPAVKFMPDVMSAAA
jgi:hypothetical protein